MAHQLRQHFSHPSCVWAANYEPISQIQGSTSLEDLGCLDSMSHIHDHYSLLSFNKKCKSEHIKSLCVKFNKSGV